ncbi:Endonuclease/exonuclease/phosphatase superfamily [Sesbania bispinosa]|nr:Endonuclease/exonuclease/phosphatase superfamily [Sesbania bispinosa]
MGFARVSASHGGASGGDGELTSQEKNLLDMSKKKPKVVGEGECFDTVVQETPPSIMGVTHVGNPRVNGHNISEEDKELFELDAQLEEHAASADDEVGSDNFVGDPLCPLVRLTQLENEAIRIPWKRSLLEKLLGKHMSLRYFHALLLKLWRQKGNMEVIDIDYEYFVIKFEDFDDLQHVLDDGPWMLADHYIVIKRWQPSFFPIEDDLRHVAVWVRIPGLPIEFYDRRVLRRIGGGTGTGGFSSEFSPGDARLGGGGYLRTLDDCATQSKAVNSLVGGEPGGKSGKVDRKVVGDDMANNEMDSNVPSHSQAHVRQAANPVQRILKVNLRELVGNDAEHHPRGEGNGMGRIVKEQCTTKEPNCGSKQHKLKMGLNLKSQILCWNVRGAGNRSFPALIRDLYLKFRFDFLAVLKPRLSGERANQVIRKLKFPNSHIIPARGFAGGILLLWREDTCKVEIIQDDAQFIHCRIIPLDGDLPWLLTCVYASPRPNVREELWNQLTSTTSSILEPWAIVGDFNSYASEEEKSGGAGVNYRTMNRFRDVI